MPREDADALVRQAILDLVFCNADHESPEWLAKLDRIQELLGAEPSDAPSKAESR